MTGLRTLLACALVAFAAPAFSDTTDGVGTESGTWTLCAAQTATGACTASPASGEERIANTFGFLYFTAFAEASTATTFSCAIVQNNEGHDAATPAGDGTTLATLTQSQRQVAWAAPGGTVFVSCSTITGGNVTINVRALRVMP